MLRIRVNKAAGAGQRRRRVRVSRTLVVNGVNLRFQNAGKLIQLRLQRGQGNVADFDVFAFEIIDVNQAAEVTQGRVSLVFQIGNAVIAQDLIFDDFVVQGFQFIQQVVDLVNVFLDAHVSIAAEFLYFFRKVVQARSDRVRRI